MVLNCPGMPRKVPTRKTRFFAWPGGWQPFPFLASPGGQPGGPFPPSPARAAPWGKIAARRASKARWANLRIPSRPRDDERERALISRVLSENTALVEHQPEI